MNGSAEDQLQKFSIELEARSKGLVIIESTLFAILQFCTIFGNTLTLYIIWSSRSLRTIPNYFVACLAVSDLGMGVLSMTLLLVTLVISRWPFGDVLCQYQGVISITMASASTQTLALTALNRYFRIVKTKKYSKVFTVKKTISMFFSVWFLSFLASSPYLLAGNRFVFHPAKFFCYLNLEAAWFTAFLVVVYVGIPTNIIMFCYLKVFQAVRKHNKKLTKSKEERSLSIEEIKITRTLFVIVVVFMGCWTPILIMDLIDTFRGSWSLPRTAYTCYTFLATFSSAINPVIYGLTNPLYRKEYFRALRCSSLRDLQTTIKSLNTRSFHRGTLNSAEITSGVHLERIMEKGKRCYGSDFSMEVKPNLHRANESITELGEEEMPI